MNTALLTAQCSMDKEKCSDALERCITDKDTCSVILLRFHFHGLPLHHDGGKGRFQ